jgi:predicted phosphodiesterase
MSKEMGLFYPDGKFKSDDEIRKEFVSKTIFDSSTELLRRARALEGVMEVGCKEATFHPKLQYPDKPIVIWHATDIHYGSIGTDYDLLLKHLNILESTPNTYVIMNGDEVDNFNVMLSKASTGVFKNPLSPQRQSEAFIEKLKQLGQREKIAVMSFGNHNNFMAGSGYEWLETFGRDVRTSIFTSGGLLHLLVGEQHYPIAITHMYWGFSKLNPTNMGKRFWEHEYPEAEVVLLGHTHQSELLTWERGGKERLISIGGTYKQDDRWARQHGIGGRSGQPGHAIVFFPYEHKFIGYKHLEDAVKWIK